jgi:hypothetical protein
LFEQSGQAVYVAFDAVNLESVAKTIRAGNPEVEIIVCGDNDSRVLDRKPPEKRHWLVAASFYCRQHPDMILTTLLMREGRFMDNSIYINDAETPVAEPKTDEDMIKELVVLSLIDYDRVRKEKARSLGIKTTTLDAAVKSFRTAKEEADELPFTEIEPHPKPVNPAALLSKIADTLRRFIVMNGAQAGAATLWLAMTWFIDVIELAPLAIINAPEKSFGKTLLLNLLSKMAYRALSTDNATASALFRSVELWRPTIFIDEADTFFRDNAELHGMINAGYSRGGFVLRSEAVGDNFKPRGFSVYSAKAIAGNTLEKHLPDATMSRGIVINLRRKLSPESVSRLRHADPGLFTSIAAKLARFFYDYSAQIRDARPVLPEALTDREQDNIEPLLAIASCAGDEWFDRAIMAALALSGNDENKSISNELLSNIRDILEMRHVSYIRTADLIALLCEDEENAWATG